MLLRCSPAQQAQREGYAALPSGGSDPKLQHTQGLCPSAGNSKFQHAQREGLPALPTSNSNAPCEKAKMLPAGSVTLQHAQHSAAKDVCNAATEVDTQAACPASRSETDQTLHQADDSPTSHGPDLDTSPVEAAAYPISIPASQQPRPMPRHSMPTSTRNRSHTPLQDSLLAHGSNDAAHNCQPSPPASGMLLSSSKSNGAQQASVPHSAFSNAQHLSPFEAAQQSQPGFQRRSFDAPHSLRHTQSMDRRRSLHRSPSMRIADLSRWRSGNLASASAHLDPAKSCALEELGSSIPIQQDGFGSCAGQANSCSQPPPMLRVSSKTLDLVR